MDIDNSIGLLSYLPIPRLACALVQSTAGASSPASWFSVLFVILIFGQFGTQASRTVLLLPFFCLFPPGVALVLLVIEEAAKRD